MLTFQQARSKAAADEAEHRTSSPENKRLMADRGEHDLATTEPTKRRKLMEASRPELIATKNAKKSGTKETIDGRFKALSSSEKKNVDPTELASAFALASLANLSHDGSSVGSGSPPRESREGNTERKDKDSKVDDEVRKAASFESETRSPKASWHPASPDPRSQREPQDIITSPTSGIRRVSFAPNTKTGEESSSTPSTPVKANKESSPSSPRQFPRGSNNADSINGNSMMASPNTMMQMSPRPHRMYGGRGLPPFLRTPPLSHQMQGPRQTYGTPPPPPHAPYHHPSSHRIVPRGAMGGIPPGSFRHGPPPPFARHPIHPQYGYSFGVPPPRFHPQHQSMPPRQLMQPPLVHRTNSSGMAMGPPEPPNQKGAAKPSTNQWICDYCNVASFSTYEEAVAHEEICKRSGPAAAALMSMSRSYSAASTDEDSVSVPSSRMMMSNPPPSPHHPQFYPGINSHATAVRRHHASMALKMGHQQYRMMEASNSVSPSKANNDRPNKSSTKGKAQSREEQQPLTEEQRHRQEVRLRSLGGHVVYPNDIDLIPPYVHTLMRQVEPCLFTESDRFVARSKGPVGYAGFQCRHCHGHAGLGKYFPVSSKSLSTNSTSQNIHAHMLKCRKCPQAVKDQLINLKIEKSRSARLEPGWRKIFFDKVWERLHGASTGDDKQQS